VTELGTGWAGRFAVWSSSPSCASSAIKQLLAIQKNTDAQPASVFVAERLWAQQAVLAAGVGIEAFILCEEALPSDSPAA